MIGHVDLWTLACTAHTTNFIERPVGPLYRALTSLRRVDEPVLEHVILRHKPVVRCRGQHWHEHMCFEKGFLECEPATGQQQEDGVHHRIGVLSEPCLVLHQFGKGRLGQKSDSGKGNILRLFWEVAAQQLMQMTGFDKGAKHPCWVTQTLL